jgi:hypothetical protein
MDSVLIAGWPDLSAEYGVADRGVEQHQREDDDASAPEHEGEAGMGDAASSIVIENGIM